jgi:hypothetical protein
MLEPQFIASIQFGLEAAMRPSKERASDSQTPYGRPLAAEPQDVRRQPPSRVATAVAIAALLSMACPRHCSCRRQQMDQQRARNAGRNIAGHRPIEAGDALRRHVRRRCIQKHRWRRESDSHEHRSSESRCLCAGHRSSCAGYALCRHLGRRRVQEHPCGRALGGDEWRPYLSMLEAGMAARDAASQHHL